MRTGQSAARCMTFALIGLAHMGATAFARDAPMLSTPLFRKFGVADGLPSSSVHALAEDHRGYLWIATVDGLARYDGTGFRIYRHDAAKSDSIAGDDVTTIFVDRDDRIWCGLESHGLDVLDTTRERFTHFVNDPNDANSLVNDDVWSIGQAADGDILLGTGGSGLDTLHLKDSSHATFSHTVHADNDANSLGSNKVVAFYTSGKGDIWIGTDFGLDVLRDGHFTHVEFSGVRSDAGRLNVRKLMGASDGHVLAATNRGLVDVDANLRAHLVVGDELTHKAVFSFARDDAGELWIGTQHGLNRRGDDGVTGFVASETLPGAISGNLIPDVLTDHEGNVWIATDDGGLMQLSALWRNFSLFRRDSGNVHTLSANRAQGLSVDASGNIWAVNLDGGIDRLDPRTGFVQRFGDELAAPKTKGLFAATLARDGRLWLGHAAGIRVYDLTQHRFADIDIDPHRDDALGGGVTGFAETSDAMWATTNGRGLHRIDPKTLRVRRYDNAGGAVRSDDINRIGLDPSGALLVASAAGLDRYDASADRFVPVAGAPQGTLVEFAFAHDGSLWLLEEDALEKFCAPPKCASDEYRSLARFSAANGWQPATFTGMQIDARDDVWVAGPRGLFRFDPATKSLRAFGTQDGLISAEFNDAALVQRADGTIFGATLAGIVGFDPANVRDATQMPPSFVERARVTRGDREVVFDIAAPLSLAWDDRDLHFTARALSFVNPSGNRYRWKLDGFDNDWIDTGNRGEREFSQLPSGNFTLHVRAANSSGVWNDTIAPIAIMQAPPPWATRSAFTLYALLLALIVIGIVLAYRRRVERRHAFELAQQQRTFAERASAAKTDFLATMGHEIRTPMTGVLGMAELLLRTKLETAQREFAEAIQNSGRVLLRLVNDSLDLARIEAGKFELEDKSFDLHALLRDIEALEKPVAAAKGLGFSVRVASDVLQWMSGDAVRVEQIVLNLVNNAIKFSERGDIDVVVDRVGDATRFSIRDTGPGISDALRARLFQRFEQADGPQRRSGSGLGLAICRELVAHMGGTIGVESEAGVGSTFHVTLPLREAEAVAMSTAPATSTAIHAAAKIVLVEDDPIVAAVIAGLLRSRGHEVAHVANGLAALAELEATAVDIAFIDLDLPGVDGLALAKMIRSRGSETILVGVSARSVGDEEHLCLEVGMNAFLRKPISGAMLDECLGTLRR